jgi:hypothetical protein
VKSRSSFRTSNGEFVIIFPIGGLREGGTDPVKKYSAFSCSATSFFARRTKDFNLQRTSGGQAWWNPLNSVKPLLTICVDGKPSTAFAVRFASRI